MVDITHSMSDDQTEVIFSASTSEGEDWMGDREVRKPVDEAAAYVRAAQEEGLTVKPFP
jgi:hypothetical protein